MNNNKVILQTMALTCRGRRGPAEYADALLPGYQENPLIEALPEIWSAETVTRLLSNYPTYEDEYRAYSREMRFHLIHDALDLFVPLSMHFTLENRISIALRKGYQNRNPTEIRFWNDIDSQVSSIDPTRLIRLTSPVQKQWGSR